MSVERMRNYVAGRWEESVSDRVVPIHNPATGEQIAEMPFSTREEVERVVSAAKAAYPAWRETPPVERARCLFRLRALMEEQWDELARVITLENGKTLAESRGEVLRSMENVEVGAGIPSLMMGHLLEDVASGIDEFAIRRPLGVAASLNPFNFPAMIPFWSLPYALACGNCAVVKASPRVPMTMVKVFELIDRAGFPQGVVGLVLGDRDAGEELLANSGVQAISFVGSTRVGRHVYRTAAEHGKRAQVQAGAKNFGIVMPDAKFDSVIPNLIASGMGCSGPRCLALAAVIAVGDAYERVRDGMLEAARVRKIGSGLDEGVEMGPMFDAQQLSRAEAVIADAVEKGAEVLVGGKRLTGGIYDAGHFFAPTVLTNITDDMRLASEEVFAPILPLIPFEREDEVVAAANDTEYGLAGYVLVSDFSTAVRVCESLECGVVGLNDTVPTVPQAPFGGWKESGVGREGGYEGIDAYMETKYVSVGLQA